MQPDNQSPAPILTSQQEGYCQSRADGLNKTDSYRANYDCSNMLPKTVNEEACLLDSHPKIAPRILSLQQATETALAAKRGWDKQRLIDEAEQNLEQSRALDQMAPANGALQMIGKATGILKEQPESLETATDAIIKLAKALSEAQLRGMAGQSAGTVQVVDGESRVVDGEQGP